MRRFPRPRPGLGRRHYITSQTGRNLLSEHAVVALAKKGDIDAAIIEMLDLAKALRISVVRFVPGRFERGRRRLTVFRGFSRTDRTSLLGTAIHIHLRRAFGKVRHTGTSSRHMSSPVPRA